MAILTSNSAVDNNARDESREAGCDKCVKVANLRLEKILYIEIFFIASYRYKNNESLVYRYSTYNEYVAAGIWGLCCEDNEM